VGKDVGKPRIKGRGSNPKSHNNKPKLGTIKVSVTLTPSQCTFLEEYGDGNRTEGVRRLIALHSKFYPDNLPYPQAIANYLLKRIAAGDTEAEQHWEYLQSWAVDQAMNEVVVGRKTPDGAYIV
jgi:hypothetical protein